MKTLVLKIKEIKTLNEIAEILSQNKKTLSSDQIEYLSAFLRQLPTPTEIRLHQGLLDEAFEVEVVNWRNLEKEAEKWLGLFDQLPGSHIDIPDNHDSIPKLSRIVAFDISFNPTYEEPDHWVVVELKTDGSAEFDFNTVEEAKRFPELFNFKGTWKEAYVLIIKTLKNGWPMELFPEEFQKLLSK